MIYVDDARNRLGRMQMAHMTADTLDELLRTAGEIGLRREWLQGPPAHAHVHFDLCQAKRRLLISRRPVKTVTSRELAIRARYLALEVAAGRQVDLAAPGAPTNYHWPSDGILCFICGQRFMTPRTARAHFGVDPARPAACQQQAGAAI